MKIIFILILLICSTLCYSQTDTIQTSEYDLILENQKQSDSLMYEIDYIKTNIMMYHNGMKLGYNFELVGATMILGGVLLDESKITNKLCITGGVFILVGYIQKRLSLKWLKNISFNYHYYDFNKIKKSSFIGVNFDYDL
jgi:hypothetical protein